MLNKLSQRNFYNQKKNFLNRFITNNSRSKPLTKHSRFLLGSSVLTAGTFISYHYFLDSQQKRKVRIYFQSMRRAVRSFNLGIQIAVDYKWNLWGLDENGDEYNKNIKECHLRAANRLVDICIKNGGLYVKLGQGLSTMNHILPKEFYLTLRKLQTQALRSEGNDIDELFKEEFNKMPNEVFREFDYNPLAAASLAQVHKAVDFEGNEVAVKLQYIDLQDRFAGDVFTCRCILEMIGFAFKNFNFSWVLDEMKDTLEKELDFINEANNSKRCYDELKSLNFVYVPKVYDNLTTKKILCMEFINGVKISETDEIKKMGLDLKEIDEKLVKMFAEQIFNTGFVHADPHHGNIYIRKKEGTKNQSEIVLLDHGLYDSISEDDRKNLCKLWKNIILRDEDKMKYYSSKLRVQENYYMIFSAFLSMRPLHRPIHDKFIFNSDWIKMTQKEKDNAIQEGKFRLPSTKEFKNMSKEEIKEWRVKFKPFIDELKDDITKVFQQFPRGLLLVFRYLNFIFEDYSGFCDILTMEPPMSRLSGLKFKRNLDETDILKMRETVRDQIDRIQVILKQVNPYMLLVLRNLNTVRSIVHDHGNLVDRHTIMARIAITGAYKEQMKLGWKMKLKTWFEIKIFDFIIAYDSLKRWAFTKYLFLMVKFGRIQNEIFAEINEAMTSNDYH